MAEAEAEAGGGEGGEDGLAAVVVAGAGVGDLREAILNAHAPAEASGEVVVAACGKA